MTLEVYLLALLTAVMWGIMQAFYKRGLAAGGSPLQSSLTVVGVNLIIFWVLLLVMQAQENIFANLSLRAIFIFSLGGLLGTALGRWLNAVGIDRVGATVNSAASSSRPLFTAAIAMLWLGETGEPLLYLGIVLLVAGVVMLTFSKGGDIRGWRPRELWVPPGRSGGSSCRKCDSAFWTHDDFSDGPGSTHHQSNGRLCGLAVLCLGRQAARSASGPPHHSSVFHNRRSIRRHRAGVSV